MIDTNTKHHRVHAACTEYNASHRLKNNYMISKKIKNMALITKIAKKHNITENYLMSVLGYKSKM
tara:strand:+ start:402 stop:596 length:195 start_codon:yes stop_codon:yes gene_type:complete